MTVTEYPTWRERMEADRRERELLAQLEREAAEAKRKRAAEWSAITYRNGVQLGFAWHCLADDCETGGNEVSGAGRDAYADHMRGHGKRPMTAPRMIKLRRSWPPATGLPKLEVPPFKWLRWTEPHTELGMCECGHTTRGHHAWHGNDGVTWKCGECDCASPDAMGEDVTHTAERRGQFWAVGHRPHTVWVLPFDAAPWEDGRPAPVLLAVHDGGVSYRETYERA